jgi:hypothetical protein
MCLTKYHDVKIIPCLINHHTMKAYGRYISTSGRLTPGERRASSNHRIGSWVGPRFGLDVAAKIKIPSLLEWNPGRPARIKVIILTELKKGWKKNI